MKEVKQLIAAGHRWEQIPGMLTPAQLPEAYAWAIKQKGKDPLNDGANLIYAFKRRPHLLLVDYLIDRGEEWTYHWHDRLLKIWRTAAKKPEVASWLVPAVRAREAGIKDKNLKRVLSLFVRTAGVPKAPLPPTPVAAKKGTSQGALLALIEAAPDDDEPRLVYADWLLEHGIGWGEVIQLALQAEKDPSLEKKLRALEKEHKKQFLAPILPFIHTYSFHRGLIKELSCDAEKFTKAADAIADRAPQAWLTLTRPMKKVMPAVAAAPLSRFEYVKLDTHVDDSALSVLSEAPALKGLAMLELGRNFTDEGVVRLAASAHLTGLQCLRLSSSATGLRSLKALVKSKPLQGLNQLRFGCHGAHADEAVDLVLQSKWKLEILDLYAEGMADKHAKKLFARFPLTSLSLPGADVSGKMRARLDEAWQFT